MRSLVVVSTVFLIPALAAAEPQCAISSAMARPANVAEPLPAARLASADVDASRHETAVQDSALPAVLRHVAGAGAQLTEMGSAHGLRSVVARNGQQFLLLHVVPDGSAAVAGVIAELTPTQLLAAAPGQTRELGTAHGLRGIFVSSGSQFQVFYVTPDGERVIPGAMWDSAGKNVTRDQVSPISGAVATVEIGPGASGVPVDAAPPLVASSLAAAQAATSGLIGDLTAPKLWIFIDPMCSFSVRAMQQLQPLIEAKRLQVAVIPIAILDTRTTAAARRARYPCSARCPTRWCLPGPEAGSTRRLPRKPPPGLRPTGQHRRQSACAARRRSSGASGTGRRDVRTECPRI